MAEQLDLLGDLTLDKKNSSIDFKMNLDELFQMICLKNSNIINMMVKENPDLLHSSLHFILKLNKKVIDFENKRSYFYA